MGWTIRCYIVKVNSESEEDFEVLRRISLGWTEEAVEDVAGGGRGEGDRVAVVGDGDGVGDGQPVAGGKVGGLLQGVLAGGRRPREGELVGGWDDDKRGR